MKRFFAELFPNVYKMFSQVKVKGNELLPVILQLVESEIVLKRVARSIGKVTPELPIFTIHDSVVTLADHSEMVRHILKREFEVAIGLKPSLSSEIWKP
jgi:hypothetical protein